MKERENDPVSDPNPFDMLPAFLVTAFKRGIRDYTDFADTGCDLNPKSVTAHHTACKAVLAHLTALLRLNTLSRKHASSTEHASTSPELDTLLRQARHLLVKDGDPHDPAHDPT